MAALAACLLLAATPAASRAQDAAEQIRAQYDDAVAQLKAAQDRKNELQAENDRLAARVAELEAAVAAKGDEAKVSALASADRSFFLRSHYAAWQAFVADRPDVEAAWRQFVGVAYGADPAPGSPSSRFDLLVAPGWPTPTDADAPPMMPATEPAVDQSAEPATRPVAPTTEPAGDPKS